MAKKAKQRRAASSDSTKPQKATTRTRRTTAETAARKAVIETAINMSQTGLSPGRSGNVSIRFGDGMLITPSGMAYETIKAADIVYVDADGTSPREGRKPSSEWRFHLSVYQTRADAGAIVHTHSLHATVIACTGKSIPAFHYMVAIAGGSDIPCVPYATFGTTELANHVADGLRKRDACLMANHGQIALASNLTGALDLAQEVEIIAEQYAKLLALGQPIPLLDTEEMARVLARFKGYGQNAQSG